METEFEFSLSGLKVLANEDDLRREEMFRKVLAADSFPGKSSVLGRVQWPTCQSVNVTFCIRQDRLDFTMVTNKPNFSGSTQHKVVFQSCCMSQGTWQGMSQRQQGSRQEGLSCGLCFHENPSGWEHTRCLQSVHASDAQHLCF